jgi:hypothetical protein
LAEDRSHVEHGSSQAVSVDGLAEHLPDGGLVGEEEAAGVGGQNLVPSLHRALVERGVAPAASADAGDVKQDIKAAPQQLEGLRQQPLDLDRVGGVGLEGPGSARPGSRELDSRRTHGLGRPPADHHPRSLLEEPEGGGQPNAAGPTDNQAALISEAGGHGDSPRRPEGGASKGPADPAAAGA